LWDLEQPWLVRYQFYLFVFIERKKLQASKNLVASQT